MFVCAAVILAMTLGPAEWIAIVFGSLSLIQTALAGYFAAQVRKVNALQRTVAARDARLEETTQQLVDQKVEAKHAEVLSQIEHVNQELARIGTLLEKGESKVERLQREDTTIQVEVAMKFGEVKTWMAETFASKQDVRELRQQINGALAQQRRAV